MSVHKICLCSLALIFSVGSARATLIDSFSDGKQSLFVSYDQTSDSSNVGSGISNVIGGYRDVSLQWLSGDLDFANVLTSAGKFSFTEGTSEAQVVLMWDGDNALSSLNYLLGANLTDGGDNGFLLNVLATTDTGVDLTMTVYTDATHASTYGTPIAGGFSGGKVLSYGDFTPLTGAAGPADFSNVGAIVLTLSGSGHSGSDITLGTIQTVPEPSSFALAAIGAAVALGLRRRWKKSY